MPQFTVQDVRVEQVQKGPKNRWEVATVVYTTQRGEQKEKKVVSFSNPGVFTKVKELKSGTEIAVEYTPGDEYYGWGKLDIVTNDPKEVTATADTPASGNKSGKVLGNQYETRDERNTRQLHIVRQSSISNAIAMLAASVKPGGEKIQVEEVLMIAQSLVDFVYTDNESLLAEITSEAREVPGE